MHGLHSYLVEIDPFFYNSIEQNGVEISTGDRGGHLGQTKPQHGKVVATLSGSPVKEGDTLFFVHFDLYDAVSEDGKMLVLVREEHEIAYSINFPSNYNVDAIAKAKILPLKYAVAKKVPNPQYNDDAAVQGYNVPQYLPQQYKLLHDIKELGLKKGYLVCVYKGSDYVLPYLPTLAFLLPEFITFNMTMMTCVGEFVLIEMKQAGYSHLNGVSMEEKPNVPNAIGTISRNKGSLKKGDTVRFHWRKAQQSPLHPSLFNPLYSQIMTKIK